MTITKHGITYKSVGLNAATHYYHAGEGEVFPMSALDRLHKGHCVLPVVVAVPHETTADDRRRFRAARRAGLID